MHYTIFQTVCLVSHGIYSIASLAVVVLCSGRYYGFINNDCMMSDKSQIKYDRVEQIRTRDMSRVLMMEILILSTYFNNSE